MSDSGNDNVQRMRWTEGDAAHELRWQSEKGLPPPKKVLLADDTLIADVAYRLASEGSVFLWRGDYQNAKQLLQALVRRAERPVKRNRKKIAKEAKLNPEAVTTLEPKAVFNQHRQAQAQRARILDAILIPVLANHTIPLRRSPDVTKACLEVFGNAAEDYVLSLRELLGVISAHEWRKKGVVIPSLVEGAQRLFPHYGVFSPIRGEYIQLVAMTPFPAAIQADSLAFDIGIGTGVLAAVLAQRGIQRIIGTDQDPRALECAKANMHQLGLVQQVEILNADLFPPEKAALIVCNPPWLPARPSSPIERAIYDPDSMMLKGFLSQLEEHLLPGGEGWLILSDLAEHLQLRSRDELLSWIAAAGLTVIEKRDVKPTHPKVSDASDPLHHARKAEVTSLWRLAAA
jgi:methylase of polypeptide subunit release factors